MEVGKLKVKLSELRKQDVKIFQTFCNDSCFMAQRVMWHLMKHRMRDARTGDMEESVNVMRDCKVMAAEDSWPSRSLRQRGGSKY